MKRKILTAGAALLIAAAAIAGNGVKHESCCAKGSKCEKTCSKKCNCGEKNCSPENCKSKTCGCRK
jgi:hypothetical protein